MYICDDRIPELKLAYDEKTKKYVGFFTDDNDMIKLFPQPFSNLYSIFNNLSKAVPSWKDMGFGVYTKELEFDRCTITVREKKNCAEKIAEEKAVSSSLIFPELKEKFEIYCNKRIQEVNYINIEIKNKNKRTGKIAERNFFVGKNNRILKIADLDRFYGMYPYYHNYEMIPKEVRKNAEELMKKSIEKKQDVKLNSYLKKVTNLEDDKIIKIQEKIREKINNFVFEKDNIEHAKVLFECLKEASKKEKDTFLMNVLYSTKGYEYNKNNEFAYTLNSYTIFYTKKVKNMWTSLIINDKDCLNIINTDFITNEKREEMILNNNNLLSILNGSLYNKVNLNIFKKYLKDNVYNLKQLNVSKLIEKDNIFATKAINIFLLQKRRVENISFIETLLIKYNKYICDYTIGECIKTFPLNKIPMLLKNRNIILFTPNVINRLNNEEISNPSYANLIKACVDRKIDVIITDKKLQFIEKKTGKRIEKLEEYSLSKNLINTGKIMKKEEQNKAVNNNTNSNNNIDSNNNINISKKNNINISKKNIDNNKINDKIDENINVVTNKKKDIIKKNNIQKEERRVKTNSLQQYNKTDTIALDLNRIEKEQKKENKKTFFGFEEEEDVFELFKNDEKIVSSAEAQNMFLHNLLFNNICDTSILKEDKKIKEVLSIEIGQNPLKTTYIEGENIDITGFILNKKFNDATTEVIEDYEVLTKIADKENPYIKISYNNEIITIPINIENKKITSIFIKQKPNKIYYIQGQPLDLTGLIVEGTFNNNTTEIITDYTYKLIDNKLNIIYSDKMATINLNIVPKIITGIKLIQKPNKLTYFEGENICLDGLILMAKFNDGSQKEIKNYDYNLNKNLVNITYKNFKTSFHIKYIPKKIQGFRIKQMPYKTNYFVNEKFNPEGLIVEAIYNNGTTKEFNNIKDEPLIYKNSVLLNIENKEIEIKINLIQKSKIGLTLLQPPEKTVYSKDDVFKTNGMIIGVKYNDGTTEEIDNYDYNPKSALQLDTKNITIYYDNFTLDIPISVKLINKPKKERKIKQTVPEFNIPNIQEDNDIKKEDVIETRKIIEEEKKEEKKETNDNKIQKQYNNNKHKNLTNVSLEDLLDDII